MQLPTGTQLQNGKYRILRTLGQGGFGITYLAEDETFGEVALKELFLTAPGVFCTRETTERMQVIPYEVSQFESFKSRFREEARTLYRLRKIPGVVEVQGFFEENGTVYLPMEYLQGEQLENYVKARKRLPVVEGVKIIKDLAKTLQSVHKQGVLHRDIKPANIIIGEKKEVTLIDFGIARQQIGEEESHTTFNTPQYAPPEQKISSEKMGEYSDVFSLGATAYFMFTGKPPQTSEENDIKGYLPPENIATDLPLHIANAITKCLQSKPVDRFQDVEAFLEAISLDSMPEQVEIPVKIVPQEITVIDPDRVLKQQDRIDSAPFINKDASVTAVLKPDLDDSFAHKKAKPSFPILKINWALISGSLVLLCFIGFGFYKWLNKPQIPPTIKITPSELPKSNIAEPPISTESESPSQEDNIFFEENQEKVLQNIKGTWKSGKIGLRFDPYSMRIIGKKEVIFWNLKPQKGGFLLNLEDNNNKVVASFRVLDPFDANNIRLELKQGSDYWQATEKGLVFRKK
jgi:serine/threonine protein kinase